MRALVRMSAAILFIFAPLLVLAQPRYQIGFLSGTAVSSPESVEAFRQELRDLGWVEGRNFSLVFRHGDEQAERLAERAADLVRMKVDIIVATVPVSIEAARQATTTIPIVMVFGPDPASSGMVTSLAHPGGNVTGLTSLSTDLAVKQLELLKAIAPGASRVAVLWNPANPWHANALRLVEAAGNGLGIGIRRVAVRGPSDFESAFATMARERISAILSLSDPVTFGRREELAALALQYRLPMMSGLTEYTEAGGLASYWPNTGEMFRSAAVYVHRILGGARPSDLPVEQPKTFEFVINIRQPGHLASASQRQCCIAPTGSSNDLLAKAARHGTRGVTSLKPARLRGDRVIYSRLAPAKIRRVADHEDDAVDTDARPGPWRAT